MAWHSRKPLKGDVASVFASDHLLLCVSLILSHLLNLKLFSSLVPTLEGLCRVP